MSKSRFFCGGSALAVTLVLSVGAQSAMAQQGKAPPKDVEVSEVITTGTYIRGAAEDAALPVEVTTREELERAGNPTVNELVRSMSEAGNLMGEDNRNGGNIPGVATINLRNLTSGRTLVLLNGQRLPQIASPSTAGDTQDSSVIPSEVLQQVEVLKDGGSTTYGSDAVAGVVNFKTRSDLNGMEASASYKFVTGSSGDYDGNVQWGRRGEAGNVLISGTYTHRSDLSNSEREWMRQPEMFNIGNGGFGAAASGGWTTANVPGAYAFYGAPGAANAAYPVGSVGTAPIVRSQLGSAAAGTLIGTAAAGTQQLAEATSALAAGYGTVRDPLCNQLGGFRGFQTVLGQNVPACLGNFLMAEDLVPQEDRYRLFADSNFNIGDKWRLNVGFNFSKNVLPERVTGGTAGNNTGGTAPCDPYDTYVTNSTTQARNCLSQANLLGVSGTPAAPAAAASNYYVTGYNPALQHFMSTAALVPTAQAGGGTPAVGYYGANYFNTAQQNAVSSCLPGLTTAYTGGPSCATIGTDAPGRGQLRLSSFNGLWSPFGLQGNPAFESLRASERDENTQIMLTSTLKGSVGELFGSQIDVKLSGSYNHSFSEQAGKGILVDRLQRALNGFATNLNDRSGGGGTIDRCTAGETLGVRPGATAATPFSAGAGGGWGNAPGAGTLSNTAAITNYGGVVGANVAAQPVAGNGCYFFNPFASAVSSTHFGQSLYTNVTGSPTQYGFVGTGFYQGYGNPNELTLNSGTNAYSAPAGYAGTGLQNDLGVVNWLYENRWGRNTQDFLQAQLVFNGTGGLELPGGPAAWAVGGEYRFYRRDQRYDTLSDRSKNPCSFISTATGTAFANRVGLASQNDVNVPGRQRLTNALQDNYSVTCNALTNTANTNADTTRTGVWYDGFGGTEYVRSNRTVSAFGELSLPLLENFSASLTTRYEDTTGYSGFPAAAVVSGGALKWTVNDKLIVRASASQTFDGTDCACDLGLNSTAFQVGTTGVLTGTGFTASTVDQSGAVTLAGTSAGTRTDVYGNTQLAPETGTNYSLGFIFRPTSSLELQLQLSDIKVKGTPIGLTATTLARRMVGKGGNGQSLDVNDFPLSGTNNLGGANAAGFNCFTDQTIFHNVDPASGQSLVRFLGANGAIVEGCTTQAIANNTTLNGYDDLTNALGGGVQHYSLLYSLPSSVNAGGLETRSVDMSLTYRFPNTVFGGVTTFGSDLTYQMFYNNADTFYNGALVSSGSKVAGGTFGSSAAARTRGSISLTWVKGKNTLTLTEHVLTSMADFTGTGIQIPAQSATAGGYTNYNPANSALCNTTAGSNAILSLAPDPRRDISGVLGAPGVGEGPLNVSCNAGNYVGGLTHGVVWTDAVYLRNFTDSLRLTVAVDNLFDTPPPFSKQTQYYYASAGLTGLGRTVKVALRKKF